MKHFLITSIFLLAMFKVSGQTDGNDCAELNYQPHYINPSPTVNGKLITDTPENDPPTPPTDEIRGIFFVHGIGGNANSWDGARKATAIGVPSFPPRKAVTELLTYGSNSLVYAGLDLVQSMGGLRPALELEGVKDQGRNFVIAHSQGGLVTREADMDYDILDNRMFGGIVTFGTAHGGAHILNSRDQGDIKLMAKDACEALGDAEILNELGQNVSPFLFNLVADPLLDIVNGACNAGSGIIPELLFSELYKPISNDYHVGAPDVGILNAHGNPNVFKVAMHGVEYADGEDPMNPKQLMFRTFSSWNITSLPSFEGDDDNKLVDDANEQTAKYLEMYNFHSLQYALALADGWPFVTARAKRERKLLTAYAAAHSYMQQADKRWKFIIGAYDYGPNPPDACMCEWINTYDGWSSSGPAIASSPEECQAIVDNYNVPGETVSCNWVPVPYEISKASDGIVLQESQIAFPGAKTWYMDKTNHFQERNSSKTKTALLALYNGEILDFFLTKEK